MNQQIKNRRKTDLFNPKKLVYWIERRKILITSIAVIGALYQFATLSCMFSDDILTAHNIALWNGYFPWWTIFFTFTFWTNFICFITYVVYSFFIIFRKLQQNNFFLHIACTYITVVFAVVIFALFPAAFSTKTNVDFTAYNPYASLSYAGLAMPHVPGPILFIFFSLLVFSLNRHANKALLKLKYLKALGIVLIFFICYLFMDIIINHTPIGAYYINEAGQKVYYVGYSVYSIFTNINPNLPILSGKKVVGHGSGINLLWYALGILILILSHTGYYLIIRYGWNPKTLSKPKFKDLDQNWDW